MGHEETKSCLPADVRRVRSGSLVRSHRGDEVRNYTPFGCHCGLRRALAGRLMKGNAHFTAARFLLSQGNSVPLRRFAATPCLVCLRRASEAFIPIGNELREEGLRCRVRITKLSS